MIFLFEQSFEGRAAVSCMTSPRYYGAVQKSKADERKTNKRHKQNVFAKKAPSERAPVARRYCSTAVAARHPKWSTAAATLFALVLKEPSLHTGEAFFVVRRRTCPYPSKAPERDVKFFPSKKEGKTTSGDFPFYYNIPHP